jgi:peroxiredoxin
MAGSNGRFSGPRAEIGCLMTLLSPGTPAPNFSAEASDGRTYRLDQLLGASRVLLVFYPGNNTPG